MKKQYRLQPVRMFMVIQLVGSLGVALGLHCVQISPSPLILNVCFEVAMYYEGVTIESLRDSRGISSVY